VLSKLKHRALLFYGAAVASSFAIVGVIAALSGERSGLIPVGLILWFAVIGVAQFAWLKCPHCHNSAILTPRGMATPFVGDTCRHCGKVY
jgi:hypothetical protein